MTINRLVNEEEKEHIAKVFYELQVRLEDKIQKDVHDEMLILSTYKGELARSYQEVAGHKSVLTGLMKDLLDKQDELIGSCNQLRDMAYRIERFFLKDVAPAGDFEHE